MQIKRYVVNHPYFVVNLLYNLEWSRAREKLITAIQSLGFPSELGEAIAKQPGSPKAINRMISYLQNVKPKNVELVVDEMLAISSKIDA